jgi:hypothetical protein
MFDVRRDGCVGLGVLLGAEVGATRVTGGSGVVHVRSLGTTNQTDRAHIALGRVLTG